MNIKHLTAATAAATAAAITLALSVPYSAQAEDTTPPIAPTVSTNDNGWQSDDQFTLIWTQPPAQETPIVIVHYEICRNIYCQAYQTSSWQHVSLSDTEWLEVRVPWWTVPIWWYGEYTVRVWLEDQAGNVNPSVRSNPVSLLYDADQPTRSTFIARDGWLDAAEARLQVVLIDYDEAPVASGITGWAITQDGSVPGTSYNVPSIYNGRAMLILENLDEGLTQLRARPISGSGVPGADWALASTTLKVDKTRPTVLASVTNPGPWHRNAATIRLKAADQAGLSGMDPAPIGEPIEDGGHLTYSLDGGAAQRVRGDDADVTIDVDGTHALAYRAYDAAGNASDEETVEVRIDGTPPSAHFLPPSSADPLRLAVVVSDAASGVASGEIEMRRSGSSTYRALSTRLQQGLLIAELDDAVPDGRYEIRVRARDHAGNAVSSSERIDGGPMTLSLPVRKPTRLRLATQRRPVKHNARPAIRGRLQTSAGRPLGNAVVTVLDQPTADPNRSVVASLMTDSRGRFDYRAKARRPSRSIRISYGGTKTIKPVFRDVPVKVRAGVTLSTNRTWLLNGQSVVFSGRLAGPVPKGGKVVALQARKRSGWVTFGTPRANRRGVFKLRYRFTSTTGLQKYRFRAVAVREGAYPYETGASRPISVTVRGL